jgi:hypothetical protein
MQPSKTVQYDPLNTVMFAMRSTKSGLNALILRDRAQDLLWPDNLANDRAVFEKNHEVQQCVYSSVVYRIFWRFL